MRRWIALALVLSACHRPVAGRQTGASVLDGVSIEPRYVREGVPIALELRVTGAAPGALSYAIAGIERSCTPERVDAGRYRCVDPGLDRATFPQGSALVVVELEDATGRKSVATAPITVDFDCPRVSVLRASGGAAEVRDLRGERLTVSEPGQTVQLSIEASEPLGAPPLVSRGGHPWDPPQGGERSWSIDRAITSEDASTPSPIVVRVVDLAGNSSGDLCPDGALPFAVDHGAPVLEPSRIEVLRGVPGTPTSVSASAGAFSDDVGVREVRLYDDQQALLATIEPRLDGSIPVTHLPTTPGSRLSVQAVDVTGKPSLSASVAERWQLSVGSGSVPGAALRTAARLTPGVAESTSMENRTTELALDVLASDGRAATVRADVGFVKVGALPNAYENRFGVAAGYDPVGGAIVVFGGAVLDSSQQNLLYGDRTVLLHWSERDRQYVTEMGPSPQLGVTPLARRARNIAFDREGCGVLFGGDGLAQDRNGNLRYQYLDDAWQICRGPHGYRWTALSPQGEAPILRIVPVVYDPENRRFIVAGGESQAFGNPFDDAFFLEPGATPSEWRWTPLEPLPERWGRRRGHLAYWDPRSGGLGLALGFVSPFTGEEGLFWTYKDGQWSAVSVPGVLRYREDFGADYDVARRQVVLWGGDSYGGDYPEDGDVWFMTGSSTVGPSAWRRVDLDAPNPRWSPSVVYDEAREQTLIFGGFRRDRSVPPDVHALVADPSWPYLEATIALGAARPSGIEAIELELHADGTGDARDAGTHEPVAGVEALVWRYDARAWEPLGAWEGGPHSARISARPGAPLSGYLSDDGHLTLKLRSRGPATEQLPARLVVDRIDGALTLRSGP